MPLRLRPAVPGDAPAYRRLLEQCLPYQVFSTEQIAYRWRCDTADPRTAHHLLAAVDGEDVVGMVRSYLNTWTSRPGEASLTLLVDPRRRRAGVGSDLLCPALAHLAAAGARQVTAWGMDDPAVAGFAAARGFTRAHETRLLALPLDPPPAGPPPPEGVRALPAAEVDPRLLYRVDAESVADEPGTVPLDAVGWADWLADAWHAPGLDKQVSTAVLAGGECVAFSAYHADRRRGLVLSVGTGTLRAHRGRGYATLAKRYALRAAAAAGYRTALAGNDGTNAAMLAVNRRLGYRHVATEHSYTRPLPGSGGPPAP